MPAPRKTVSASIADQPKKAPKAKAKAKTGDKIFPGAKWNIKNGKWTHINNDHAVSEARLCKQRDGQGVQSVAPGQLLKMEQGARDAFLSSLVEQDKRLKTGVFSRPEDTEE